MKRRQKAFPTKNDLPRKINKAELANIWLELNDTRAYRERRRPRQGRRAAWAHRAAQVQPVPAAARRRPLGRERRRRGAADVLPRPLAVRGRDRRPRDRVHGQEAAVSWTSAPVCAFATADGEGKTNNVGEIGTSLQENSWNQAGVFDLFHEGGDSGNAPSRAVTVTLHVTTPRADGVRHASREDAARAPELLVHYTTRG